MYIFWLRVRNIRIHLEKHRSIWNGIFVWWICFFSMPQSSFPPPFLYFALHDVEFSTALPDEIYPHWGLSEINQGTRLFICFVIFWISANTRRRTDFLGALGGGSPQISRIFFYHLYSFLFLLVQPFSLDFVGFQWMLEEVKAHRCNTPHFLPRQKNSTSSFGHQRGR